MKQIAMIIMMVGIAYGGVTNYEKGGYPQKVETTLVTRESRYVDVYHNLIVGSCGIAEFRVIQKITNNKDEGHFRELRLLFHEVDRQIVYIKFKTSKKYIIFDPKKIMDSSSNTTLLSYYVSFGFVSGIQCIKTKKGSGLIVISFDWNNNLTAGFQISLDWTISMRSFGGEDRFDLVGYSYDSFGEVIERSKNSLEAELKEFYGLSYEDYKLAIDTNEYFRFERARIK